MRVGTRSQVANVPGELLSGYCFWRHLLVLTETQVAFKCPSICLNGVGGKAQIPLDPEPSSRMLVLCDQGIPFPTDICHGQLLPMKRTFVLHIILDELYST